MAGGSTIHEEIDWYRKAATKSSRAGMQSQGHQGRTKRQSNAIEGSDLREADEDAAQGAAACRLVGHLA